MEHVAIVPGEVGRRGGPGNKPIRDGPRTRRRPAFGAAADAPLIGQLHMRTGGPGIVVIGHDPHRIFREPLPRRAPQDADDWRPIRGGTRGQEGVGTCRPCSRATSTK